MINVYDNGAIMIGNIDMVINEIKDEINKDIDMIFADKHELLKDLEEIKKDGATIVYINYDRPMGDYSIDYWLDSDKLDINKENIKDISCVDDVR